MSIEQYQVTFLNSKNTFLKKQNKIESFLLYNYFKTSNQKLNLTLSLCESSLCSKETSFSNFKYIDFVSKKKSDPINRYILKQKDILNNVEQFHLGTKAPSILELDKRKSNYYLSLSNKLKNRFCNDHLQNNYVSLNTYDSRFAHKNIVLRKNYSFLNNFEQPSILNYLIKSTLVKNFTIFMFFCNTFFLFFNKYFSIFHSNVLYFSWIVALLFLEKLFYNRFIVHLIAFDFYYKKLIWQTKNFRHLEILTLNTPFQNNFLKIQYVETPSNSVLYNKNTCINTFFFNKYIFSKKKITSFSKLFVTLLQYKHFFLLSKMKTYESGQEFLRKESFFFKRHFNGVSSKRTLVNLNTKLFKKIELFDIILKNFKIVTKHDTSFLKLQSFKKSKFVNMVSTTDWNTFSKKKHLSIDKFLIPDWIEKGIEMEFYFKENIVRPTLYKKSKRIKKKVSHFSKSILYVPNLNKYNTCKHYNFLYNKYNVLLKNYYFNIQKQEPFILHYRKKSIDKQTSHLVFKNLKKNIPKLLQQRQIAKKKRYSLYKRNRHKQKQMYLEELKKKNPEEFKKYGWFTLPLKEIIPPVFKKEKKLNYIKKTFSTFNLNFHKKQKTKEISKQFSNSKRNALVVNSKYFVGQYVYFVNKRVPQFQETHSFFLLPDRYGRHKWRTKRFKTSKNLRYTLSHAKSTTLKPFKKKVNDRNFKQHKLFTKYRSFFSNTNKKTNFSIFTSFSRNLSYSIFSISTKIPVQKFLIYYYYYLQYKYLFLKCITQQIEKTRSKRYYFLRTLLFKNSFQIENVFNGVGVIPVNLVATDLKVTKFLNCFFEKNRQHLDFVSHLSFKSATLLNKDSNSIFIFLYFFPLLFKSMVATLYKTKTFFFNFKKSDMHSILFLYYFSKYIKYKVFTNKLFFHFVSKLRNIETNKNTCKSFITANQNVIIWNRISMKRMILWNSFRYNRLGFRYLYSSFRKKRKPLKYYKKKSKYAFTKKRYSTFNNVFFKEFHFNTFLLRKLQKQNSSFTNYKNPYFYLYIYLLNSALLSKYYVNNEILSLQQKLLKL